MRVVHSARGAQRRDKLTAKNLPDVVATSVGKRLLIGCFTSSEANPVHVSISREVQFSGQV